MARPGMARWLFWSSAAVVGLLGVAAVSSSLWLRPLVERQLSAKLSRPVTIARLHLQVADTLEVSAEDVVVGNPEGFSPSVEPFARIARVTAHLDLATSFRRRQVVIASLELDRPVLRVVVAPDGHENYRVASPTASGSSIGVVRIQNGRARVSLAPLRADFEVAFATEQGTGDTTSTKVMVEARGAYAGQPAQGRFAAEVPADTADPSQPWPIDLEVQNGPTSVVAKGALKDPIGGRSATLDLRIAGPDMALLEPLTAVPFPATPPYDLRGKLDSSAGVYTVSGITGRLGRSDLDGVVKVVTSREPRPEITAELHSREATLGDIVSLLSGQPGSPGTLGQMPRQRAQAARAEAEARANPRLLPQGPLRLPNLKQLDVHLAYHADRLKGASMPFDNLALRTDLVDGVIAVQPVSFGVGQGRITGNVSIAPQGEGALRALTNIRLDRVDVSRLLRTTGASQGAGALSGAAHLESTGQSVADILGNANGAASLWMTGGDVNAVFVDLAGLRLGSALLAALGGQPKTRVACFVADLALWQGVMSARKLLLETDDAVTQGAGAVDLKRERVEVRLRTQSKRLTVGVLPAPLLVSGTLKNPHAAPDPASPAGQGGIAGALAALPTIQLGIDEGSPCQGAAPKERGSQASR